MATSVHSPHEQFYFSTVTVKVTGCPAQPLTGVTGVTVTVPVVGPATLAAVKAMLPVPVVASLVAGLLFVQLKTAPGVPLKATLTGFPPQTVTSGGVLTVVLGRAVTVHVSPSPLQSP